MSENGGEKVSEIRIIFSFSIRKVSIIACTVVDVVMVLMECMMHAQDK